MFLLDSSGSIFPSNFTRMLLFASRVASEFMFGTNGAQFGVVTFSNVATLDIRLGEFSNISSFNNGILQIPFKAKVTNTSLGLRIASREILDNGRDNVPSVIIVLTDGRSDEPTKTQLEASFARSQGIRILAIGIGSIIDAEELYGISTDPDEDHVFLINDFSEDSFAKLLAPLVKETCGMQDSLLSLIIYIVYIHMCNLWILFVKPIDWYMYIKYFVCIYNIPYKSHNGTFG